MYFIFDRSIKVRKIQLIIGCPISNHITIKSYQTLFQPNIIQKNLVCVIRYIIIPRSGNLSFSLMLNVCHEHLIISHELACRRISCNASTSTELTECEQAQSGGQNASDI